MTRLRQMVTLPAVAAMLVTFSASALMVNLYKSQTILEARLQSDKDKIKQREEIGRLIRQLYPARKDVIVYTPGDPSENTEEIRLIEIANQSAPSDPSAENTEEKRLIEIANQSDESRTEVIQAILAALNQKEVKAAGSGITGGYFILWNSGCRILGKLKATEAIDFLIKNIGNFSNITWGPSEVLPPEEALCAIGEEAVPKLRAALLSQDTPNDHRLIAIVLRAIGGESATEALESAYKTEKDAYTRDYLIKRLIDSLHNKY